MRSVLLAAALILIYPMLSGCGTTILAPATAPASLASTVDPARASEAERPFAYVAEVCRTSSCASPSGFVQMLGGPTITKGIDDPRVLTVDGSGNLYVGNSTTSNGGDVSVYGPKSVNPQRILGGIIGEPDGLAANAAGRLVVIGQHSVGCCGFQATGAVFAPGATEPRRRLKDLSTFAGSPVLDKFGNLYVSNFSVFPGWVSVYHHAQNVPSRFIQKGIGLPTALAVAPNGDLVVGNGLFSLFTSGADVVVYPAGKSLPSLTITAGLQSLYDVAVDDDGNIYVANIPNGTGRASITVYRKGHKNLWRSIHSGITAPVRLAFDGSGRLYVANAPNNGTNTIVVYAAGGSKPLRTYTLKDEFSALAVPR
jgi:hypothetical protein